MTKYSLQAAGAEGLVRVRDAFVAPAGCSLVCCDYSQVPGWMRAGQRLMGSIGLCGQSFQLQIEPSRVAHLSSSCAFALHATSALNKAQVELRVLAHLSGDPALVGLLQQAGAAGDAFKLMAAHWLGGGMFTGAGWRGEALRCAPAAKLLLACRAPHQHRLAH